MSNCESAQTNSGDRIMNSSLRGSRVTSIMLYSNWYMKSPNGDPEKSSCPMRFRRRLCSAHEEVINGLFRRLLAILCLATACCAFAAEPLPHEQELYALVVDVSTRAGITLELQEGECAAWPRLRLEKSYCVSHDLAQDIPLEDSLLLLRATAADHFALRFEGHPRITRVQHRPPGEYTARQTSYTLTYDEGVLNVLLKPDSPHLLEATFVPRDPIRPCLEANATSVNLFDLAQTYGSFDLAQARAILACADTLDVVDAYEQTPLYYAIAANDPLAVRDFLRAGARPNHRANGGWTPLLMAVRDTTSPQVIRELLDAGADPLATPDDNRWRNALWYAHANEHLIGTEPVLQLALSTLYRASQAYPPQSFPGTITPGSAPYLPPEPALREVEVLLLQGSTTITARGESRVVRGVPSSMEQFGGRINITATVVEWRMPIILSGRPHVAVIVYLQNFEMAPDGDFGMFEDFVPTIQDEVTVAIYDTSDGTWGDVVVAFSTDQDNAEALQSLGFVPFGKFALARFTSAGEYARIGQGASFIFEDTFTLDGIHASIRSQDVLIHVTPQEVRVSSSESTVIHPFTHSDFYQTITTEMRQEASYEVTHRLGTSVDALKIDGEIQLMVDVLLQSNDFAAEFSFSMEGPMSFTGNKVSWIGQTQETQRGVLNRITRLLMSRFL